MSFSYLGCRCGSFFIVVCGGVACRFSICDVVVGRSSSLSVDVLPFSRVFGQHPVCDVVSVNCECVTRVTSDAITTQASLRDLNHRLTPSRCALSEIRSVGSCVDI